MIEGKETPETRWNTSNRDSLRDGGADRDRTCDTHNAIDAFNTVLSLQENDLDAIQRIVKSAGDWSANNAELNLDFAAKLANSNTDFAAKLVNSNTGAAASAIDQIGQLAETKITTFREKRGHGRQRNVENRLGAARAPGRHRFSGRNNSFRRRHHRPTCLARIFHTLSVVTCKNINTGAGFEHFFTFGCFLHTVERQIWFSQEKPCKHWMFRIYGARCEIFGLELLRS